MKKEIYDVEMDQNMVWAYLCGRNHSPHDVFTGVNVVFASPENAYFRTKNTKEQNDPLKNARRDATQKTEKQTTKRVSQLRGKKK